MKREQYKQKIMTNNLEVLNMSKRIIVETLLNHTKLSLVQVLMVADLLSSEKWYCNGSNCEVDIKTILDSFITVYKKDLI